MGRRDKRRWVRLDFSRFENGGDLDYILSMRKGAEYLALYVMLCTITGGTKGVLAADIDGIVIPYDVDKIRRECKHFSRATVVEALEVYRKLGLVDVDGEGVLSIPGYADIVGSECSSAVRVRALRGKKALQSALHCNTTCNTVVTQKEEKSVTEPLHRNTDCNKNVTLGVTQKEESADGSPVSPLNKKNISPSASSLAKEENPPPKQSACAEDGTGSAVSRPTLAEVRAYFKGNMLKGDPDDFLDHYTSINWIDPQGRTITDWRAVARRWTRREDSFRLKGTKEEKIEMQRRKGVSDL